MTIRMERARPSDADVIASMVGELLHEIMAALKETALGFHQGETEARARS